MPQDPGSPRTPGVRRPFLLFIIFDLVIFDFVVSVIELFNRLSVWCLALGGRFGDSRIGPCPWIPRVPRTGTHHRRELAGELRPVPTLRGEPQAGAAPTSGA